MNTKVENIDNESFTDFVQKDLGSEFVDVDPSSKEKKYNDLIKIIDDKASEITYLFIFPTKELPEFLNKKNVFNDSDSILFGKVLAANKNVPNGSEVLVYSERMLKEIEKLGLKRITLVGVAEGANVVQALTILSPRLFRRAVLIDPQSRMNPAIFTKIIDWIEKYLPVGLPFKASNKEFDSRPFLHRIRCPILVLKTPSANFYNVLETNYIASKIPNCYHIALKEKLIKTEGKGFSDEFLELLKNFNDVPVKRPQKNL